MKLSAFTVFAVLSLVTSAAFAKPGIDCRFYGINPGAPTWDGKVLIDEPYAAALAASGAGTVRINFRLDGAGWSGPALTRYDEIIDRVRAHGLEPLGLLAYEGVPGGQVAWNDDADGDGFNPYVDQFANTAKLLFAHFKGRVHRWEIWNEPNCWSNPSFAKDPQHAGCTYVLPRVFAKLLAESYVRSAGLVDSGEVTLVSGGLFAHDIGGSTSTAADYLSKVYDQGVWDWLKANTKRHYAWGEIGYHIYVRQGEVAFPPQISGYLDTVRATANARGDGAAFSLSEFGWTTAGVSPKVQAQNLTIIYDLLAARSDVNDAHWFAYGDSPAADLYFGLVDPDGKAKPALAAYHAEAAGCMTTSSGSGAGGADGGAEVASSVAADTTTAGAGGAAETINPASTSSAGGAAAQPATHAGCSCESNAAPSSGSIGALMALGLIASRRGSSENQPRSRRRSRCAR